MEIIFPDGITCRFSAPLYAMERSCRLQSFKDVSGNEVTLVYSDLWLMGADNISTNFGRLSYVLAPTGDNRRLDFYYTGNRISTVELVKVATVESGTSSPSGPVTWMSRSWSGLSRSLRTIWGTTL